MESMNIDILNPKAKNLLQNLADLELIKINKSEGGESDFLTVVSRMRNNADSTPTLDEISREVDAVRKKRNGC